MIDTKKFYLVDSQGYENIEIAELVYKLYGKVPGTKIIYDEEEKLHYIVQKRKKKRLGSKQAHAVLEAYRKRIAAEKGIDSS